jgi:hypothetical protein
LSYFDTLANGIYQNTFNSLVLFLEKLTKDFKIVQESFDWKRKNNVKWNQITIQRNKSDCGPFTCLMMRRIMEENGFKMETLQKIKQSWMINFRKLMRKEFLCGEYCECVYEQENISFFEDDLEESTRRFYNLSQPKKVDQLNNEVSSIGINKSNQVSQFNIPNQSIENNEHEVVDSNEMKYCSKCKFYFL